MGSLQWSQRLSPPFLFALRRWSPRPRHFLSLKANPPPSVLPPRRALGLAPRPGRDRPDGWPFQSGLSPREPAKLCRGSPARSLPGRLEPPQARLRRGARPRGTCASRGGSEAPPVPAAPGSRGAMNAGHQ